MTGSVHIDPVRCRGHAVCAVLFASGIELDRWGFGRTVSGELATPGDVRRARRAAAACPNGAVVVEVDGAPVTAGRRRRRLPVRPA